MASYQVTELSSDGTYTTKTVEVEQSSSYKKRVRQKTEDEFIVLREVGYMRVSSNGQDTALQEKALRDAGCSMVFRDEWSGRDKHRPGLDAMLHNLTAGDRVNVWKVDRLGRSTIDSLDLVNEFTERKVAFRSLTQDFDTATPIGRFIMRVLMIFAEFERENIVERVVAGLDAARERGIVGGTRRSMDGDTVQRAREAYANRPMSPATGKPMNVGELARMFNVHRATFLRWAQPDYLLGDTRDAVRFRQRHPDIAAWIEATNDPHAFDSPRRRRGAA